MTLVFYDGVCGLCDRFVQFLVARDRQDRVRFAQLQGDLARRELVPRGYDLTAPASIAVIAGWQSEAPRLLTRSRAVLHAVGQLGPVWRAAAAIARLVPRPVTDAIYAAIARRRYRLFGRFDTCPLPRLEWRGRFLD